MPRPSLLPRMGLYGLVLLTAGLLAGYAATELRRGFSVSLVAYMLVVPAGLGAALGAGGYWWRRWRWAGGLAAGSGAVAALLLSLLLGVALSQPAAYRRFRQRATEAEQALRTYHRQHHRFPGSLAAVPAAAPYAPWLDYQASPDGQAFTLSYSVDEWHQNIYHSRTRRWREN